MFAAHLLVVAGTTHAHPPQYVVRGKPKGDAHERTPCSPMNVSLIQADDFWVGVEAQGSALTYLTHSSALPIPAAGLMAHSEVGGVRHAAYTLTHVPACGYMGQPEHPPGTSASQQPYAVMYPGLRGRTRQQTQVGHAASHSRTSSTMTCCIRDHGAMLHSQMQAQASMPNKQEETHSWPARR